MFQLYLFCGCRCRRRYPGKRCDIILAIPCHSRKKGISNIYKSTQFINRRIGSTLGLFFRLATTVGFSPGGIGFLFGYTKFLLQTMFTLFINCLIIELTLGCVFCCFVVVIRADPVRCLLNKSQMTYYGTLQLLRCCNRLFSNSIVFQIIPYSLIRI